MSTTALAHTEPRRRLLPLPVVVDADVLLRNVDYVLRRGWRGALIESASGGYSLLTGVVLFATDKVVQEVERNLPKIAQHRRVLTADAFDAWEQVLPILRIVEIDERLVDDPRVSSVRTLHANDAPTAALAVALAPCLLLTDNRDHFLPLGLPDQPTDEIAIDVHELSQLVTGANGAMLFTELTGAAVIGGSKKVFSRLGKDGAFLVALILIGAAFVYWKSERGGRFREGVASIARDAGPPLMRAIEDGLDLSDKISGLAIEPADGRPSAFRFLAQRLAIGQTTMSTVEVARYLSDDGYSFSQQGDYRTLVRAWLVQNPCFFELQRGHWSLGYHAAAIPSVTG
jgi:hypothetical protein